MGLLQITAESTVKLKYAEVEIHVFLYLPEQFINFRKDATRIMAIIDSSYVCERLFSFMKATLCSQRTRILDNNVHFKSKSEL